MPIVGRDSEFLGTIAALYRDELGRDPDPGGQAAWLEHLRNGMTGEELRAALHNSVEGVAYRAKPPAPPQPTVPHLEVRGRDFVDADGRVVKLNGVDGFMDFRLYTDGGEAALDPFMAEATEFHFNARRVFLQGSIRQNTVMQLDPKEPGYYDRIRPFVDYENRHGIIPLLTIGVDNQDIQSPIEHWVKIDELTQGQARIISFFNEQSKNRSTFGPGEIPPASGLWSRGSDAPTDTPPFKPTGPVLEFHPVRNYTTAMRDAIASPIELFEVKGYTGALIIDEPGRMGTNAHDDRFTDPRTVGQYATALSVLCAGAVMHNWFGQRGLLMDELTRACAVTWSKGMK